MDNPLYQTFIKTIYEDLANFRPHTTNVEMQVMLQKSAQLFQKASFPINFTATEKITDPITKFRPTDDNDKLFMYRTLYNSFQLPHSPPVFYKTFSESSRDIYENYLTTLDYLLGYPINPYDVNNCKQTIIDLEQRNGHVLCWSNTSFVLERSLMELSKTHMFSLLGLDIVTFGSPKLLTKPPNVKRCTNLYHEDDWILGLVSLLYKIDLNTIERDTLYTHGDTSFMILSRANFDIGFTEPHRYYYTLFS